MFDQPAQTPAYLSHYLDNYSTLDYARPIRPIHNRCCVRVWGKCGHQTYQCIKLPGNGPDGAFCEKHARQLENGTLATDRYR